jgi:hypothetical protein
MKKKILQVHFVLVFIDLQKALNHLTKNNKILHLGANELNHDY